MKIGITGAFGYVGTLLCQELVKEGKYEVVGVDNFHKNQVSTIDGIEFHKIDIRNKEQLKIAFKKVDVIVHLASITGIAPCNENPEEAYDVNVNGTNNVCWVANENKTGLIFAASFALFGNPEIFPIKEEHKMDPINWYGQLKYMGYKNIEMMSRFCNFPAITLVKSNIYGAYNLNGKNITKPTVVNKFILNALEKKPIEIFKPGNQERNFIHVKDVISAYIAAIDYIKKQGAGNQLIHIAGKESVKILDIAKIIQAKCKELRGYEIEVNLIDTLRENEVTAEKFSIDILKAENLLNFKPKYTLEKTIEEMLSLTY